ncbi:MAG TPA: alkaline phosphatase family protein [Verrucomicrobiae bacterium]|nr:alkaline phosphatase family protein [Verrucomicrobiae bacterium]
MGHVFALLAGFLVLLSSLLGAVPTSYKAEHVVVIVWDGLRPDSVTAANTPTLFKLAHNGVFFQNHHAVYLSSTEVNGVALATGTYPNRNNILANHEYRPDLNPLKPIAIESIDAIRKGDASSGNHYLNAPTVAEILRGAKMRSAIAGTKPVARLHDRLHRESIQVTGNATQETPNTRLDTASTRALIGTEWDNGVPAYSLLWLSEPDYSQHLTGPGSPKSLKALKGSDDNLALVLKELDKRGLHDKTDVFVVSDHGFSTIDRCVDVAAELQKVGFHAAREFKEPPVEGDVMVVGNGGSVLLYVVGHDPRVTHGIVDFLQHQDWPGVLFTRERLTGTFALEQARLNTPGAPDVVISLRWKNEKSSRGIAGTIISDGSTRLPGDGNHATLSPYDMRATLVAAGPDLRKGMVDQLPTGNADVAPTILHLLGVDPPQPMDGRVLGEALSAGTVKIPAIEVNTLEATREMGKVTWHQYLRVTGFGGAIYFDEGNGQATSRQSAWVIPNLFTTRARLTASWLGATGHLTLQHWPVMMRFAVNAESPHSRVWFANG